ncbi:hypothetical protein D3C84_542730 [compost metagenome]
MAKAGIHRHASLRAGQHLADTGQVQLGQHFGVAQAMGDTLGARLLRRVAPRQLHRHAHVPHALGQFTPVGFRPVLGVPRGAVQEQHIRVLARQFDQALDIQAIVAQALRQVVAQRHREQLAQALDRMLTTCHRQSPRVKACGQGLTGRMLVQPGHRGFDITCQPGALEQALGIDHQVVFCRAHALLEALPLTALEGLPDVLAPATDRHRNHLVHRRVPGRDFGEAFFHHPVELDPRDCPRRIGQRWQRMNHITQRRGLDQQYPQLNEPRPRSPAVAARHRSQAQASVDAGSCNGQSGRCDQSKGCTRYPGARSRHARPVAG